MAVLGVRTPNCICNCFCLLVRQSYEVSLGARRAMCALGEYLEDTMKKLVLAAALTAAASTAFAGNMAEPVIEAPVIVEEASSSSAGGVLVPLIILAVIAAVAAD